MGRSRTRRWCAIVFIAALLPRLTLALWLPSNDSVFMDEPLEVYARNFAQGRGFWMPNPYGPGIEIERAYAFRPPLFPLLWGLVYEATDGAYRPIRAAHALIGALTCAVAFLAAREMARRFRTAALTGLLCAVYPPLIWHSVHPMTEPLFIFFSTLAIWRLMIFSRTARRRDALGAGLAAGLATLTRSVLLPFLPVLALWMIWRAREIRPPRRATFDAALFLAAAALTLSPWAIRNRVVLGAWAPSTTDAGHGFYAANNACALHDPRGFWIPRDWTFLLKPGEPPIRDEVTAYRRLLRAGMQFWKDHPADAVGLLVRRFATFWGFWPKPEFVGGAARSFVYAAGYVPAFLAMLPGVCLLLGRRRRNAAVELALLYVLFSAAIHTAVLAMLRYREPLMPFLLCFSAVGALWAWDRFQQCARRRTPSTAKE